MLCRSLTGRRLGPSWPGTAFQIGFPKISGTKDWRGSEVVEGYGGVVGRLALLARRADRAASRKCCAASAKRGADRAASSTSSKQPLARRGGGASTNKEFFLGA